METNNVALILGNIVLIFGGVLASTALLGFLLWLMTKAWDAFSNNLRSICKTESLIWEYIRNRHEYHMWKALKGESEDG